MDGLYRVAAEGICFPDLKELSLFGLMGPERYQLDWVKWCSKVNVTILLHLPGVFVKGVVLRCALWLQMNEFMQDYCIKNSIFLKLLFRIDNRFILAKVTSICSRNFFWKNSFSGRYRVLWVGVIENRLDGKMGQLGQLNGNNKVC